MLRSICYKCVRCRTLDEQLQQQVMGAIPRQRLNPAPAWAYTSVDLFGPYEIRGEINKRTRGKGYGVIFTCMLCRAVHLDVATEYNTDAFLLVLRRFISVRGCPMKMWSDQGSQIAAADKESKEAVDNWDRKSIVEFGAKHQIDWEFCSPDAPWQNGAVEALIKSVKRCLKVAVGKQVLTFSEIQTLLFEVANLVNERPIGRHPTSVEDGAYLSPNDLLLGRASSKISSGPFSTTTNKYIRHAFIQKLVDAFWKKWNQDYFPSLTVHQKWHTRFRNVKVGDIVLVQESGLIKGVWKMGKITKADPSLRDGFVRNVDIQYKNANYKSFITITRPVQRIVVIVPIDDEEECPIAKGADSEQF